MGFVYMRASHEVTANEVLAWARSIGVTGPSTCVVYVKLDAEPSLVSFLERSLPARFERAAPQSPETVGSAERTVRYFKETLAILRQDYLDMGFQLAIYAESLPFICRYIASCHNFHHKVFGGSRTPHQHVIGQDRPSPVTGFLGSVLFAEVPDSVESPSGSRFVVAAYLGYEYSSKACLVSGKVGPENALKVFKAKSIRLLNKIRLAVELCPFLFSEPPQPGEGPSIDQQIHEDPDPNLKLMPPSMPKSGPPKEWLDRHGRTEGCSACRSVKLHGRAHSVKCKRRYLDWERLQRESSTSISGSQPVSQPLELPVRPPVVDQPDNNSNAYSPSDFDEMDLDDPDGLDDDVDMDIPLGEQLPDSPMDISLMLSKLIAPKFDEESLDAATFDNHVMSHFCGQFTPEPEKYYQDLGLANDLDPKKGILSPFYLPKIGEPTEFKSFQLGGSTVFLATPARVFSEENKPLDRDLAMQGRLVELEALNRVRFGKIVSKKECDKYCQLHGIKPIACRWVLGSKEIDNKPGVRCRLVVQQIAAGNGVAATLGYSSATPSTEAVRALLIDVASQCWTIGAMDVSTAFMHADLPPGVHVAIRLPADVSATKDIHSPTYAIASKALNGLRCASKAWLQLAKQVTESHGLLSCPTEPCAFKGVFRRGKFSCRMVLILYVDDILVGCDSPHGLENLRDAFLDRVSKVKITGQLNPDQPGTIIFLGREITRFAGSKNLYMRVPTSYLYECLANVSQTDTPPQIDLEKDTSDKGNEPLSAEAASKYRSILGRVAWYCQTRQDLLRFVSILSTGQSVPLHKHEIGLNKLLRYLKSNLHIHQELRNSGGDRTIHLYTDASWGGKSYSGYVIFWCGSMLKSVSRCQVTISLSACEAEMVAIAQGCQETLGVLHLLDFFNGNAEMPIKTIEEFLKANVEELPKSLFVIRTDSESSQKLLQADGFNRRTRHLHLAHAFVQRLIFHEVLVIQWVSTDDQIADVLTKILDKVKFEKFRKMMGFIARVPPESWQFLVEKSKKSEALPESTLASLSEPSEITSEATQPLLVSGLNLTKRIESDFQTVEDHLKKGTKVCLFLEICTKEKSGFFSQDGKVFHGFRFCVVQVTRQDDICRVSKPLHERLDILQKRYKNFHVCLWFSPPCTGGIPAQFLVPGYEFRQSEHFQIFAKICKSAQGLFEKAAACFFEMSRPCQFWKSRLGLELISKFNLSSTSYYDRCSYSEEELPPVKHTFRVQGSVPLQPKLRCICERHRPLFQQNFEEMEVYPVRMTKEVASNVCRHFRDVFS